MSPKHQVCGISGESVVTPDGNVQTSSQFCRYHISRFGLCPLREAGSGIPMKSLVLFCLNCVKRENASSFLPHCADEVRERGLLIPEFIGGSF